MADNAGANAFIVGCKRFIAHLNPMVLRLKITETKMKTAGSFPNSA